MDEYFINRNLFSENLKKIRKEKGLTREELADKINMSWESIKNYEMNRREPKISECATLAKALGCTMSDLTGI